MNKKGLTPLMATVLLLVFALVIGTITMNWGKGYVERLSDSGEARQESIVIPPESIDEPLKEVMIDYILGSINKQEYYQKAKEFS